MILHFSELASTNSYLRENLGGMPQYAVVTAGFQTAGRGQRGNGWESEPGANLLFSMLYYPPEWLSPSRQFLISKAVALAVAETVDRLLDGFPHPEVCIKWPNDIYVGDRKIAGILIENSLQSAASIAHSIIGVGLNINQREFRSGAPNPVSAIHFTDRETPLEDVTLLLRDTLASRLEKMQQEFHPARESTPVLNEDYFSRLWRRRGFHPYIARTASIEASPTAIKPNDPDCQDCFDAEIVDVAPDGLLTVRLRSGQLRAFSFKEIVPVLPKKNSDIFL